jgi:hypothetical protein
VLREVIERCLEKSADARFATAEDLASALRRAHERIDALGPITEAEARPPPMSKASTRRSDQPVTMDSEETSTLITRAVGDDLSKDDEARDPTMTWPPRNR